MLTRSNFDQLAASSPNNLVSTSAISVHSTFSLDTTGVYGTGKVPQGLGYADPITISFAHGVSDVSFDLVNHGTASFVITDNLGPDRVGKLVVDPRSDDYSEWEWHHYR
jgi:hypothetical protein